jgi:hypothetical protein
VAIALALATVNSLHRPIHFGHNLIRTGIHGILDDQLFRTARSSKRNLEDSFGANPLVNLDHLLRSDQQGVISTQQFIHRSVFDNLLFDFPFSLNRFERFHLADLDPNGGQWQNGGVGVLVFSKFNVRLIHGDGFLVVSVTTSTSTPIVLLFKPYSSRIQPLFRAKFW